MSTEWWPFMHIVTAKIASFGPSSKIQYLNNSLCIANFGPPVKYNYFKKLFK